MEEEKIYSSEGENTQDLPKEDNILPKSEEEPQHSSSQEEPIGDFINDLSFFEPYHEVMPEVELEMDEDTYNSNKKGLKVFALVMAAIILLCGSMTAGYYFGKQNSGTTVVKTPINVDLAAKPADTDMLTAAQVYEKADKSVVGIMVYNSTHMASASGVVYSEDGYIITNDHIYGDIGAAKFKVYTSDGNMYSAEYVAGDTRSDIAVIKITDKVKLTPAEFGNPDELYVGEPVVAVGRPTGAETDNNLTGGYVSTIGRRAGSTSSYTMKYIQTDTAINPGSSGGALLNMYGQVVGITSSKLASSEYEGMSFAIPMDIAKMVAESLINNGYVKNRAKLGISYTEINSLTAEVSGKAVGLYIALVDESSDLFGKVAEGDIITEVNGEKIITSATMLDIIDASVPGDVLTLVVLDSDGKERTVTAELLADKGSSSYMRFELENDEEKNDYTSEFDFPFGD